jgi:hypothetical protein
MSRSERKAEMSQELLTKIIGRASVDEEFRFKLIENAEAIIKQNNWELTDEELKALKSLKIEEGEQAERALDERVSKALYGTDTHSILW